MKQKDDGGVGVNDAGLRRRASGIVTIARRGKFVCAVGRQ
jgi:hypothetical protein